MQDTHKRHKNMPDKIKIRNRKKSELSRGLGSGNKDSLEEIAALGNLLQLLLLLCYTWMSLSSEGAGWSTLNAAWLEKNVSLNYLIVFLQECTQCWEGAIPSTKIGVPASNFLKDSINFSHIFLISLDWSYIVAFYLFLPFFGTLHSGCFILFFLVFVSSFTAIVKFQRSSCFFCVSFPWDGIDPCLTCRKLHP